jgi:hypothetical protein
MSSSSSSFPCGSATTANSPISMGSGSTTTRPPAATNRSTAARSPRVPIVRRTQRRRQDRRPEAAGNRACGCEVDASHRLPHAGPGRLGREELRPHRRRARDAREHTEPSVFVRFGAAQPTSRLISSRRTARGKRAAAQAGEPSAPANSTSDGGTPLLQPAPSGSRLADRRRRGRRAWLRPATGTRWDCSGRTRPPRDAEAPVGRPR